MKMDKETCLRLEYIALMQKAYQPDKESLLECHVRIFRYYCEREFPPPHYHINADDVCKPC